VLDSLLLFTFTLGRYSFFHLIAFHASTGAAVILSGSTAEATKDVLLLDVAFPFVRYQRRLSIMTPFDQRPLFQ
jgi:hypothetical protein